MPPPRPPTRRAVLAGLAGGGLALAAGARLDPATGAGAGATAGTGGGAGPPADVAIAPRAAWAGPGAAPPTPPLAREAPGDVHALVVHHTAGANGYAAATVPGLLRGIYAAHVARGWPDVAYGFFVDRHGGVWEGRAGSLDGPVIGDATGGNQGHAVLCCFVGDHRVEPPTPAATAAMTGLLAWLADRHGLDTTPGARAAFTSRGSNRWPAGATVTVPTICGHRDVSRTACPGDAGYALVADELPALVTARRAAWAAAAAPASPAPTPSTGSAPSTGPGAPGDVPGPQAHPGPVPATGLGLVLGLAAAGGALLARRRRVSGR